MQAKQIRPHPQGPTTVDALRRTVSGASTASRESSVAQDSTYDTDTTRFHQGRSRAQSQLSTTYTNQAAYDPYQQQAAGAVAALQGYGNPQGAYVVHPGQPQYGLLTGAQNNAYYGPVMNQPEYIPTGQQTRNGTPALGGNGTDVERKDRKAATTTAANEKELRELLEKNEHRNLESIARDVRQAERTQKSERAKQLFAMRWLREFCKQDTDSVPRNRVYTHYSQRCGTDRVDTLNAASFGKLVRIIFPGIQTRRLGVRGESKYHYVNLRLLDDPGAMVGRPSSAQHNLMQFGERAGSYEPDTEFKPFSRLPADTATFPPQESNLEPQLSPSMQHEHHESRGLLFASQTQPTQSQQVTEQPMYSRTLKFTPKMNQASHDDTMNLPNIYQFIPAGTDNDLADALGALYRTHCTSLVDAVRYVKQKSFFRLLGTFNGKLTVPVSKLFAHPSIAPWVKMCDWFMYQQIVRFLSQLTLQVLPAQVFLMLKEIANTLPDTLRRTFAQYPTHVIEAKLEAATVFASLLHRLLRVNEAAHAAATFLINDQVRNVMWQDWTHHVRPRRALESELPSCGYAEGLRIMTVEMRQLLEPLDPQTMRTAGPDFLAMQMSLNEEDEEWFGSNTAADGILERWAKFLEALPSRFPQAPTRVLLHTINAVTSAALRDITISQAESFGSWWITKVWVDEMMLWQAEMGGFLVSRPYASYGNDSPQSDGYQQMFRASQSSTGSAPVPDAGIPGALGLNFQQMPTFVPSQPAVHSTGPPTATFSFPSKGGSQPNNMKLVHRDDHDHLDDSGLGMSLLSNEGDEIQFDFTN